jgi:hypothetical protein
MAAEPAAPEVRADPLKFLARRHLLQAGRNRVVVFRTEGEKNTKLAQKLDQLQPFIAVFPQDCIGQLASFGTTSHLSR